MSYLTTRRATKSDIPEMEILLKELGYQIPANSLALQLQHYSQPESMALVAYYPENETIVGLASGHVIPLLHQTGFLGRITAMVVSENSHGKGAGRKLVEALEIWFLKNQCLRYEVTSGEYRNSAHLFYEKMGYKPDEKRFVKLP